MLIILALVICWHYYLHNVEQVKIAKYTLELLLCKYMSGEITESVYSEKRDAVYNNFNMIQKKIYRRCMNEL